MFTFYMCVVKVESMFVDGAEIKPVSVGDVEFGSGSGPTGKCYVSFRSKVVYELCQE